MPLEIRLTCEIGESRLVSWASRQWPWLGRQASERAIMKSRQLANVLFKVLGFSVCLYAIPNCVSGIIVAVMQPRTSGGGIEATRIISYAIGAGVQLAIGVTIIAMSQKISAWLFKSDDE